MSDTVRDDTAAKERVALISVAVSGVMTLAKFAAAFLTGSLGLLSESIHGLLDFGATVMTYYAVRVSDKPADDEHHYGHSKIESVTALVETGLLFVAVVWILREAIARLAAGDAHVETHPVALLVIVVSIVVDFFRARELKRIARETRSEALEADALHFTSDMWSSLAVLAGLALVAFGWQAGDPLAAIVVAVFTALAGWQLGRRTIDNLTDTAPTGLAETLQRHVDTVPGVIEIERLRIRPAGATTFVDMEIAVARTRAITDVMTTKALVVARIHEHLPGAEIALIAHPRALDDETVHDRVMVIARNRGLAIHHLTVQDVMRADSDARLAVSVDLELDGRMPLAEAHAIATALEDDLKNELGPDVEVETHVEPLMLHGLVGEDLPGAETDAIKALLVAAAEAAGRVSDVHNVRARRCDEGIFVNFHCRLDPQTDVDTMHAAIDEIERRVRAVRSEIRRAIGHAEPVR